MTIAREQDSAGKKSIFIFLFESYKMKGYIETDIGNQKMGIILCNLKIDTTNDEERDQI